MWSSVQFRWRPHTIMWSSAVCILLTKMLHVYPQIFYLLVSPHFLWLKWGKIIFLLFTTEKNEWYWCVVHIIMHIVRGTRIFVNYIYINKSAKQSWFSILTFRYINKSAKQSWFSILTFHCLKLAKNI